METRITREIFSSCAELIEVLQKLQDTARALDANAVVVVKSNRGFSSIGEASLWTVQFSNGELAYGIRLS